MRRISLQIMACALAVVVTSVGGLCGLLYAKCGSVAFRCGMLATANDPFLDGSSRIFQRCSWHLGIATCTRGETYGLKVRRVFVSMEVKHVNPRVTPREAREDD